MNKVAGRAGITMIIALVLLIGFGFFLAEYFMQAGEWAVFKGSPHVYNGSNIGCGWLIGCRKDTVKRGGSGLHQLNLCFNGNCILGI